MPHIIIEVTPGLAHIVDVDTTLCVIHATLADEGLAEMDDLKSRVHLCPMKLAGDDAGAEFIVAHLITTNDRPLSSLRRMGDIIHGALVRAIERHEMPFWWQCCVLLEPTSKSKYLKTDSRHAGGMSFSLG
ncbi:hypothetical protein [Dyella koreensis]|uniref:5-carboxymethyl-2-hydroxymuconate isomerase n=1 Tax=Dyella koreensis TaxID=311235 RepID=A0ABW8K8M5_9GAMM